MVKDDRCPQCGQYFNPNADRLAHEVDYRPCIAYLRGCLTKLAPSMSDHDRRVLSARIADVEALQAVLVAPDLDASNPGICADQLDQHLADLLDPDHD